MPRDLNAEPTFPTPDIQGDILAGLPKRCELLLFFKIQEPEVFKPFLKTLHITSMEECLAQRDLIKHRKEAGIETLVPTPGLNVAFSTWSKRPGRHEAGWGWLGSALMPSFLMCPPLRNFHFPACRAATLKP
jgi:hypothetical protein